MECFAYSVYANSMSDTSNDGYGGGFSESYSCNSSDSSRSGDVAFPSLGHQHFSSSASDNGALYSDQSSNLSFNSDSQGSGAEDTYLQTYHYYHHHPHSCGSNTITNNRTNRYRVFGLGGGSKLRNASVSSPSPQQVSWKLAPFVHVGPSSWQWQPAVAADAAGHPIHSSSNGYSTSRRGSLSKTTFSKAPTPPPSTHDPRCPAARRTLEPQRVAGPPYAPVGQSRYNHSRGSRPRPRLSTCDDPHSDLLRNGRDVAMDALDVLQVKLRESGRLRNSSIVESSEVIGSGCSRHAPVGGGAPPMAREPLKRRLAQVRALIREELAEQAAVEDLRGLYGPRKRERGKNAKKCKFCLSKKEDPEIVAHHNLFDARGLVNCPILQQYECELCHATGKYAHTLKYCPENNPDTPHDVILQARLKVMLRNRRGQ